MRACACARERVGTVSMIILHPWARSTVGRNDMKSTHSFHSHKSFSHERESERASEWAQWSTRAKRAVRSKQMSERCERMGERRSEWPSALRADFIVILPNVRFFKVPDLAVTFLTLICSLYFLYFNPVPRQSPTSLHVLIIQLDLGFSPTNILLHFHKRTFESLSSFSNSFLQVLSC